MQSKYFFGMTICVMMIGWMCPEMIWAQPVAGFLADPVACLQQHVRLQNTSSGANSYEWDFCANDVMGTASPDVAALLSSLQGGYGYKMLQDNGSWYGFAVSQSNHSIIRLSYGASPLNSPTVSDLGNPSGQLMLPQGIDIIKVGTNWFGFVGFTNANYGFVRLDFGASLSNVPVATNVGMFGLTGRMWDVKLVVSSSSCFLLTVNRDNNSLTKISFGDSFLNAVVPTSVFETADIPGANLVLGLDVFEVNGRWKAVIASYGSNSILQLDLGNTLSSTLADVEGNYMFPGFSNPFRIRVVREGDSYRALVANNAGPVTIVNLKDLNPIHLPEVINQPIPNMIGIDAFRWGGRTILTGVSFYDTKVNRVIFEQHCDASNLFDTTKVPSQVFYTQSGNKLIELKAINTVTGLYAIGAQTVSVSSQSSPDIQFTYSDRCSNHPVSFTSQNGSGTIDSYAWDFGDGQTSTLANPPHVYSTSGSYTSGLVVTDFNGCTNFSSNEVVIFTQPVADFHLPPAAPICTNQPYIFVNSSSSDPSSNPTWEWRVNGTLVSTQKNLSSAFTNAVSQEIRLKATIPGCENESIKNIPTVIPGPMVSFGVSDDCALTLVPFSNTTTGADAGYTWNFGDGTPTSSVAQPVHSFAVAGTYQVTLTGSNAAGCQNQTILPVTIYSVPQPDFSVGLPPFSCSNTLTPFQNATPPLTDSNVTDWLWSFGDPSNSTSTLQSPSFTYTAGGNYTASLTATSDFGCSKTTTKVITIGASPVADFVIGPSCVNTPTQFTDISSGAVQSRVWQIVSGIFSTPNPNFTFTTPGSYTASLTVTAPGGCASIATRPVDVPVPPSLTFTTLTPCAGQDATFTDASTMIADPVVGWNWNMDGNSVTGNPASFSFPTSGLVNVKMTTTHASGCQYTTSSNITIHPSPTADFRASPDRGEPPLTVQFENLSSGANQYAWLFTDNPPATSTQTSPVYTFLDLGNYTARLTATNSFGCTDILSKDIVVLIPAVDLVLSNFSLSPDAINGQLRTTVTITNNSNIPLQTAEVALHLSEKAMVSEAITMNLEPGASGTQTLSFTFSPEQFDARFVCAEILSEKDIVQDNNKRCLSFTAEDYIFAPYPNPSTGVVQIDWISEKAGSARITVYNSMGQREYEWETPSAAGLNQSVHDLSFLSAGMYYVTIQTATSLQTQRFLRQ